ncbi:alpha-ketoacid dehydrogenase subunit beta [Anaerovorax odorimutans]|uniref:Alpha-ketoacid dehydrogenase subunit beta n=1 Tax=Anaerovorax odorimutans TaxID=109327 RepID=A0ABT1RM38_9FIRM|nr:alpha-ketoacid dehydrogenase subunit beta [Anaerovorax odorimutans]MCQ4636260.1 alpha-ketoacid dehydrogenase subunit beta [Anaerovorax odorimutans]
MKLTYAKAINEALRNAMKRNSNVFIMGEDVGIVGGTFGLTEGLYSEFGPERVRDTPITEQQIVGMSVGAASLGMIPVPELMFNDFMGCAFDQLLNQAAKFRYMYGGNMKIPMTLRLPCGGGLQAAAQHSQCLEAFLTHIPGLKVVYPSTPQDAYGLLIGAVRDENPVMYFEHLSLYFEEGEVELDGKPITLGSADVKRQGTDVTVIATGLCVHKALKAAEILEKEGIRAEVVDPRTLYPLDKETIYNSVIKTKRAVIVTEEVKRGAWSAEMAACIAEDIYESLEKRIVRIGELNTPIPYTKNLESYVIPQTEDIVEGIRSITD